ncbi:protein FAM188B-like [Tropilaelaps mercedesae]|uniref:Ubiquitin carboxyl-terminal hydrolase MINDY n=1 Tax=Tropilaelaps mercedesae TaxID=418985 RepID=A0A1V9XQX9_9ACAR|nr:protein FAM188B-like [Tropilaelaps mercedesae]
MEDNGVNLEQLERWKGILTFGRSIPRAWAEQRFKFHNDNYPCISQPRGGPCGVLAVVQARLMKALFFERAKVPATQTDPISICYKKALVVALADTIWVAARITDKKHPKPIFVSKTHLFPSGYKMTRANDLRHLITTIDEAFQDIGQYDVMSLLYSVLATKGPGMRMPHESMINFDTNDAGQPLVNLLICGRDALCATDGNVDPYIEGIPERCDIGFLPEEQSAKNMNLGLFLKDPYFPAWVLNKYEHYSVLYCMDRALLHVDGTYQVYWMHGGIVGQCDKILANESGSNSSSNGCAGVNESPDRRVKRGMGSSGIDGAHSESNLGALRLSGSEVPVAAACHSEIDSDTSTQWDESPSTCSDRPFSGMLDLETSKITGTEDVETSAIRSCLETRWDRCRILAIESMVPD